MSGDDKKPEPERRRMVRAPTGGDPAGRGMGTPVKTADHRTLSSQQWLRRQLNDPFVKAAKAHGYRARAAYKLTDIDDKFHLIRKGSRIVDLGCAPDVVLSDMAPNTLGHRRTDHLRIVMLIEAAAAFAVQNLKPGGAFVAKAFQGGETAEVIKTLKAHFTEVKHVKPKASRTDSSEVFLVATGFKGR
jgi:23S rRNA (uridine2552-2'-O)-methyltransferase